MSDAARRQRSKTIAAGSISVTAAMATAISMAAAPAHADQGNAKVELADTHPAWATQSASQGAVPASQNITTRVYLKGQDPEGLAAAARAISDPSSPQYHHYLTPAQIQAQFGATGAQVQQVTDWLKSQGLKIVSQTTDWIDVSAPAPTVGKAFSTVINNYKVPQGVRFAAATPAVIPASVANAISAVSGLYQTSVKNHVDSVSHPAPKGANTPAANTIACSTYWGQNSSDQFPATSAGTSTTMDVCGYEPKQLRDAYGVTGTGLTGKGARVAIVDAYGSSTMLDDANKYATNMGDKPFAAGQYTEHVTPSSWNSTDQCKPDGWVGEESLDVEMVHALAPDASVLYVGANSCEDNDLMAALSYIVDNHNADIVSNSYGAIMHATDGDQDPAIRAGYDRIFMKGAAEGIGFDFSTGDCGDDDPTLHGENCNPASSRKQTEWPTSSQWVTAVGGTTLGINAQNGIAFEASMGDNLADGTVGGSWNPNPPQFDFGGGGGTVEDVNQPWYQKAAVPANLSHTLMSGAFTGIPKRTIPDVAMNGAIASAVHIQFTNPGDSFGDARTAGTSEAAPLFSAIQALAFQAHGKAMGFANPTIYANAGTFRDITDHHGATILPTSGTTGTYNEYGKDTSLAVTPGYDEATGLGSPTPAYLSAGYAADPGTVVSRLAGGDRYDTGIQVSKKAFPANNSAPAVVLATGDTFADALSGVPLAKAKGAPLLLTPSAGPDARVTNEVKRVLKQGGTVYVLGGLKAVPQSVVSALGLPASQVKRLAGVDRFDTGLKIAAELGNPNKVVLATGAGFADALAAGPFAADVFGGGGAAILLTQDKVMPANVGDYLKNAAAVATVGGQAAAAAASAKVPHVVASFTGHDRYETAALVSKTFGGESVAGVATGMQFADALTGAAFLANNNGPLVLTDPKALPGYTVGALQGIGQALGGGGAVEVFGGPVAVSDATVQAIASTVGGRVV